MGASFIGSSFALLCAKKHRSAAIQQQVDYIGSSFAHCQVKSCLPELVHCGDVCVALNEKCNHFSGTCVAGKVEGHVLVGVGNVDMTLSGEEAPDGLQERCGVEGIVFAKKAKGILQLLVLSWKCDNSLSPDVTSQLMPMPVHEPGEQVRSN